jgi:hypothetical protein
MKSHQQTLIFAFLMPTGLVMNGRTLAHSRNHKPQNYEPGEGLKTHFVTDFADAQVAIEKQVLGLFEPHARQILREFHARDSPEQLAEIERAAGRFTIAKRESQCALFHEDPVLINSQVLRSNESL